MPTRHVLNACCRQWLLITHVHAVRQLRVFEALATLDPVPSFPAHSRPGRGAHVVLSSPWRRMDGQLAASARWYIRCGSFMRFTFFTGFGPSVPLSLFSHTRCSFHRPRLKNSTPVTASIE